jgi:hypothetical protein
LATRFRKQHDTINPNLRIGPWYYFACTYDGLAGKQWNFENGMPLSLTAHAIGARITSNSNSLGIGGCSVGFGLTNAVIDEVRAEQVFRSANWIWASYMTVVSNSVFSSYEISNGRNKETR